MPRPKPRCFWCGEDPLYVAYHDREWGVPVRDDRLLFEQLILEGAQSGLSWITVLRKRGRYREAFAGFDPRKVARFDARKVDALMKDSGLVRHRGKLESVALNARAFLAMQAEHGSFAAWLWAHVDGRPVVNRSPKPQTTSLLAEKISKELRRRGMKFVGPTIIHAYLQAVGVLNDHLPGCWKA
ncbi:MAG: DNA-3-methyladenine glycosylase I [Verrucomicrobia bacterium]|nr:DNA-3-methyladenine glycosylase I [Verrucomicrobiota bacterium]